MLRSSEGEFWRGTPNVIALFVLSLSPAVIGTENQN